MYLPTVSRGRNCTNTPSSVSAALSKDSQTDDYVDKQSVKREGAEAPPDNKSFSKMASLNRVNDSRQLMFKFKGIDSRVVRSDNSTASITNGAYDVIAIDNIKCRPFPPDCRKEKRQFAGDSSSCVYDKVHLSESLQEQLRTEGMSSEHTHTHAEAQCSSAGPSALQQRQEQRQEQKQGQGQPTGELSNGPSLHSSPTQPTSDGDKTEAAVAVGALIESVDSTVHVPSTVEVEKEVEKEVEVNACAASMRKQNGSMKDDDSSHDDIEFVRTSLQETKVEVEVEKEGGMDSMFSFPRYGSQPVHSMLEDNISEDNNGSTTGTLDPPLAEPANQGFFSWLFYGSQNV